MGGRNPADRVRRPEATEAALKSGILPGRIPLFTTPVIFYPVSYTLWLLHAVYVDGVIQSSLGT